MNNVKKLIKKITSKIFNVEVRCNNCTKQHTMNCPNSLFCHSTKDMPHFDRKYSSFEMWLKQKGLL